MADKSHTRQLLLGLFLLVALSILGFYTLFLTDLQLFGTPQILVAQFEGANSLQPGDTVTVAGKRAGRVRSITYDPEAPLERRITVELKLSDPLVLHEGFRITIEEATMLGGRVVRVEPGPADAPAVDLGVPLAGSVLPNPLTALGDMIQANSAAFEDIMGNVSAITAGLREGRGAAGRVLTDEELANNLSVLLANAAGISGDVSGIVAELREGRGTLGKLLTEDELYETANEIAEDLRATGADLRDLMASTSAGAGTVGRLFRDEALAFEVEEAVRNISTIASRLEAGEGTVGHLLVDKTIAINMEEFTEALNSGEGTIGALLHNDDLYVNLRDASGDVKTVAAAIREADGSLGKLIMDTELYDQALIAVQLLNQSLEDYREAAPVTTFTSVLFAGF